MSIARAFATLCICLVACLAPPPSSGAAAGAVELPVLTDNTVSPRIVYVENPRFASLGEAELRVVVQAAAALVHEHFAVTLLMPEEIRTLHIDQVFAGLVSKAPGNFARRIGDFKNDAVDWHRVESLIARNIEARGAAVEAQMSFARPHLVEPPATHGLEAFAAAVADTFRRRLSYWTTAELADGHPIIGAVPGREDLPLNEYVYWALMAKRGIPAEIVLTNQLIASVEYLSTPVHMAIRGGITGGSAEYNPASRFGASVWISLAPFLMQDRQVRELRGGAVYSRRDALRYAGVLLAHELGHALLHLEHPWANQACLMRPAEVLDFAAWADKLDAGKCPLGSERAMTPGSLRIPVW